MNPARSANRIAQRTPNLVPWINIAVGILTIASPFAAGPVPHWGYWVDVIPGIIIVIVGAIALRPAGAPRRGDGWPWINVLAGIWLFIAIIWTSGNAGLTWSNIVLGVLAIITGLVSLAYAHLALAPAPPIATEPPLSEPRQRSAS